MNALIRVGEGGTEDVLVHGVGLGIVGDSLSGSGSSDHGHVVLCALSSDSQSRSGGDIAHQSGDALIDQLGEAVDSLSLIALLILGEDLDLLAIDAALFVDLLQVQGSAVDNGLAVNRDITGQRAHDADLDGIAGCSGSGACCRSSGRSCSRSCGAGRAAAGGQNTGSGHDTGSSQEVTTRDHVFHNSISSLIWKLSCCAAPAAAHRFPVPQQKSC